MNRLFDNEDEILGLVRQEGLLKPSEDFTSQVMQCLEEKKATVPVFQPLLSKKAWTILGCLFVLLSFVCWLVFTTGTNQESFLGNAMKKAAYLYNHIDFSFEINTSALLIITMAMVCMGLLLLIDFWFSNDRNQLEA